MKQIWIILGLAVIATLIYSPALQNNFVFDDTIGIDTNTDLDRPIHKWFFNEQYFLTSREFSYRPIVTLSHILDRKFGPAYGHAMNIILHWAVAWSLFMLGRRFISARASAIGALLFLVHPAYSEVVYMITFREDILCSLFLLWALMFGLEGKIVLTMLSFGLALFSKESALMFPVFAVLLLRRSEFKPLKSALPGLFLLDLLYAAIRFVFLKHYYVLYAGPHKWLPVESTVVTGFLRLLVFPMTLSSDHAIPVSPGFWMIWPGMFAAVLALYYTARFFLKNNLGFVPLAWMVLFLTPTLNILPLPNISAERYLYLPMVLPVTAVGYWIDRGFIFLAAKPRISKIAWVLLAVWIAALGVRGHARGYDFKNNETFFQAEMKVNPSSRSSAWSLGQMYFFQKKFDEARKYLEQSLSIDPEYYPAWIDLGRLELETGDTNLAGLYFEKAVEIAPIDPLPWLMLAAHRIAVGDTAGAKPLYQHAARLRPTPAMQNQELIDILRYFRALQALEERDTGAVLSHSAGPNTTRRGS